MLPIELLHGVTFGLAWATGTAHCSKISPPGLETTTQAIFQAMALALCLHLLSAHFPADSTIAS